LFVFVLFIRLVMHLNFMLYVLSVVSPTLTKTILLKLGERSTMTQNPNFRYEDWGPTFYQLAFPKAVLAFLRKSLRDEAFVGHPAPDTAVLTLEREKTSVCSFMRDFSAVTDFLIIYIAEAHATDGWSFKNNIDIKTHRSLQDRLAAARRLLQEGPLCPVVVDDMSDVTASRYGALPERLYVLRSGKIIYKGKMGPWGYNPGEVRDVLQKLN
uniref:Iodothyronine deiodinase n=1 Tax=Lepisosteus oculatus TaxID=7918 RepID=W5M5R7_LEPOC